MRDLEIDCPFCDGQVIVDEANSQVMHTEPACAEFMRDEGPADFLHRVNMKLGLYN